MTDKADRAQRGLETSRKILGFEMGAASTPYTEGARDFVFAEVWSRPGLDTRSRRWITLACVCAARAPIAIRTYLNAALDSGEITADELREFVLQFAIFQGFPKAAEVEILLNEILAARSAE